MNKREYSNLIPKVIHYCWFGGSKLPHLTQVCMASWEHFCPNWEIVRWDETTFDVNRCRFSREAYSARKFAFVSDYARMQVIFDHGGIYLDTDVELIAPLNTLIQDTEFFFGRQGNGEVASGLGFGSVAAHSVIGEICNYYRRRRFMKLFRGPDLTPCPVRETRILRRLGLPRQGCEKEIVSIAGGKIYPASYLDPKPWEARHDLHLSPETIAIHHSAASWHDEH